MFQNIFKTITNNKTIIGTIIFLFLGIVSRFSFLETPKEVVFDEHHFFHFVSEYQEGKYFFDIHPPLGKLILWANAQLYGLPEFIAEHEKNKHDQEKIQQEQKTIKNKILELQRQAPTTITKNEIEQLQTQFKNNRTQLKYLSTHDKNFSTLNIGQEYSDTLNIVGIRSIPAFFGAALVALMFYFAYFLTSSYAISALIGFLTLFSPAFLVQSQYILMDSILMFFIIFGALFSIKYFQNPTWKNWIMVIASSAIAVSIKWTGMSLIALAGLIWITLWFRKKISFVRLITHFFAFWIIVLTFYMGTFAIHFALLPKSGEGDAFHTPAFQASLIHTNNDERSQNNNITPKTFFLNSTPHDGTALTSFLHYKKNPYFTPTHSEQEKKQLAEYQKDEYVLDWDHWKYYGKFIELNRQMGVQSASIRDNHPFASTPSDWIHGKKSIYLWNKAEKKNNPIKPEGFLPQAWNTYIKKYVSDTNTDQKNDTYIQQLHLFSNHIVWSLLPYSTIILGILLISFTILCYKRKNTHLHNTCNPYYVSSHVFIMFMAIINILPFIFIERPKFLYHAFESVLFGLLGLALVLNSLFLLIEEYTSIQKTLLIRIQWGITIIGAICCFLFFLFELPIIYGFPFHTSISQTLFKFL